MRIAWLMRKELLLGVGLALLAANPVVAQTRAELVSTTALRVCADPSDLPFSNDKGEGFENKIADLVAGDMHLPVKYTFFPDSQGFIRATLDKDLCDVVMGTAVGNSDVTTTQPYYYTGYVIVTRAVDHLDANKLSDPEFATRKFGLIDETPPTNLLLKYDLMDQTKVYPLIVDTRVTKPSRQMLEDLVSHRIDVALVWGPFAGYYIKHDHLPLHMVFLDGENSPVRLDYHIAMGVRNDAIDFRRALNAEITKRKTDITAILEQYDVPMLDEMGRPINLPAAPANQKPAAK